MAESAALIRPSLHAQLKANIAPDAVLGALFCCTGTANCCVWLLFALFDGEFSVLSHSFWSAASGFELVFLPLSMFLDEPDPAKLSNIDDSAPKLLVGMADFDFLCVASGVDRGDSISLCGLGNGVRCCSSPEFDRFELNAGLKMRAPVRKSLACSDLSS